MAASGVEQCDPSSPAPAQRPTFRGRCAAAIRGRLGRAAAALALTAVIAVAVWMIGVQVWGHFLLEAARSDVDHYHSRLAHDRLETYLQTWPSDPTALLLAARTARRLGAFKDAGKFLDRYEAVRGRDDEDLILERVLLQAQHGRVDQVREFCDARVRQNDPSAPLVLEAQAAGLIRVYRLDEALERLEEWRPLRPDDCQALLFRGAVATLRQDDDAAGADFRRVLELDPDTEEARRRLAALLMQHHSPAEAFPHLQYLEKAVPDDPRVLVQLAECRADMTQTDEARRLLDGVLARRPHFPDALAARGRLALQEGQAERAEPWLREAVARDPGARDPRQFLVQCLRGPQQDGGGRPGAEGARRAGKGFERHPGNRRLQDAAQPVRPRLAHARRRDRPAGRGRGGRRPLAGGCPGDRPTVRPGARGPGGLLPGDPRPRPGGGAPGRSRGQGPGVRGQRASQRNASPLTCDS